jgi:5-methylcytosine-specific restriction endonuclease McrA
MNIPRYLILEDTRAAYAARYHSIVPEGDELKQIIVREYGGRCVCCGFDSYHDMTLDHIVPISTKGGKRKTFLGLWRAAPHLYVNQGLKTKR